ncbi:ankyrin repeat-containing domain protein, partial [Mycena floridula]
LFDHLFDHADIHLPTLTEHQKQNEEIYLELVGGLLQSKPNLLKEPQSQKFTTGMVRAASHGSLSLLKQFVKWGADLNAPKMLALWGPKALSKAAEGGHLEIVKFILEHRVDVNATTGIWGCTLAGAGQGKIEVVEYFRNHWTGLQDCTLAAAVQGKIEVVEYLLNHGADLNARNNILFHAINGGLEIVKMLIDKGAANLQVEGEAALEIASGRGQLEIVKLLIEKGVSPKKGQFLQSTCFGGHLEVLKVLLENGADVNALDRGSLWGTALLAAIHRNRKEIVEFLIESGADVNATGNNSETPLTLAIQGGHKEIEDILRSHGARE